MIDEPRPPALKSGTVDRRTDTRGVPRTGPRLVANALAIGVRIAWLEAQTGVNYTTLHGQ